MVARSVNDGCLLLRKVVLVIASSLRRGESAVLLGILLEFSLAGLVSGVKYGYILGFYRDPIVITDSGRKARVR